MSTHFALGAVGYTKNLYTAPSIGRVVERAHQTFSQTRGPLTIRPNEVKHDGVLRLHRTGTSPEVHATYERNPNVVPSLVVPEWAGEAVRLLSKYRVVTTSGMEPVGRDT